MGDRANVYVPAPSFADPEKSEGVYLYTHWGGGALPYVVQRALRRRQRWIDTAYLTRIIFSEMVRGVELSENGYGIATYAPDNDRTFCIVVDTDDQRVTFAPAQIGRASCRERV